MLGKTPTFEFEAVFHTLDVGVIVLDSRGRIVVWNDWMAGASRISSEAAFGKNIGDLFPSLKDTRLPAAIDDALRVGSSSILTHALNRLLPICGEDGLPLLHNIVVRPLAAYDAPYCVLQISDVTVAVTRERVLRDRQNARYHAIVDSAPDAMITTSLDRRIHWVNGAAERVFGYTATELLGQSIDILLDQPEALLAGFAGDSVDLKVAAVQTSGRRKDGGAAHFEVSFGRWRADERIFVTTIWRDVTEQLAARDTLRRSNEELEAAVAERTHEREVALKQLHESQKMESIGQLTGGVAHDFNNLLAVILGSLSLLKKGLPDDPRTSRLLEGAIQGAERGATLTKRLLAFARRQELKLEAVEVQQLIPDLLDFLRQSVGPTIAIAVDIPPDLHPVKIDANQFELALMNLAVNARDAMPTGGTLTISGHDESDGAQSGLPKDLPRGDYVRISIADTGVGMNEATLAKALEPFFTTKGIGKGTGLGLSMVHGLTAQSGGSMQIVSQVGKGTVVSLWLPRARREDVQPAHQQASTVSPARESRGSRVLLVDDDSLVSMNTTYMLADLGHNVLEAPSGADALRLLETDARFDVVITDYAMPGMTGHDLATKIRQIYPKMPVIIATGYAELPPRVTLGFPRLNKPYTQQQLADALDAVSRTALSSP
jgi:PAS domain S-box-containing protein